MARYSQSFFDITQPLFVRKEFAGNNRIWLPGMLFDWKHFKIAPQRVRALFRSSYICHAAQESLDVEVVITNSEPENQDHQIKTDDNKEPISKQTKYEIRQVGGPYYDVISPDGKTVNHKSLHKSKAESFAAKLNSGVNTDEASTTELAGDTANG